MLEERASHASPVLTYDADIALRWAALGRTSAETAAALGWQRERVTSALAQAISALGAASKLEAVVIATRRGLL